MMFFHMPSTPFFVLYMICGLSDVLDGMIARKTNTASTFGARLDTIADFIFAAVLFMKLLSGMDIPIWLWVWMITIAGIKIANLIFGFVCTKRLIVEHTLLNKIAGVLLFLLPLTLFWVEFRYSAAVVCAAATFAAIQEGYYIRKGREIV
jgi:CDP-diacylglycerol--glycerol-3-phosphate 3-phosphatidyltransferase